MADAIPHRAIVLEQARLLNAGSLGSAVMVIAIIVNAAFFIALSSGLGLAALWIAVSGALVMATRLYAQFRMPDGITLETAQSYINGHVAITALTGLSWSLFAIVVTDLGEQIEIIIAATFLVSISLGGLLPGSAHRLDYITMASCALLPFPIWLLFKADSPERYFAFGYFMLYAVCLFASRKVHTQTLEAIEARLRKQRYKANSDLIVSVGHDLAQPLHAQRTYLEALSRMGADEPQQQVIERLKEVQANQEYLVTSLIDYEKAERGLLEPTLEPVDLSSLIQDVVSEFEATASSKSIATTTKLQPVSLNTDRRLLALCIRNLLNNAYKFTPTEGTVNVSLAVAQGQAEICVADTGSGIRADQQELAFEPFRRLDDNNDASGLGLGLALVKRHITALRGSVSLEPPTGSGTSIVLRLPL